MNLDKLQKIAEAAPPGPWYVLGSGRQACDVRAAVAGGSTWVAETGNDRGAAHIAAFDPPTALRLIAIARAARLAQAAVECPSLTDSSEFLAVDVALRAALAELDTP